LDAEGQQIMRSLPDNRTPAFFWRLDPLVARLAPGYVWEVDGKIVGNVTLLPTKSKTRYLVANVGVLRAYRRRGIAKLLMETVQDEVRRRNGDEILLQVDYDNESALALYFSLGYEACGNMTTWRSSVSRVRDIGVDRGGGRQVTEVQRLEKGRWKEAYELDRLALNSHLRWPDDLAYDEYKRTFWRRATDFMNGRIRQEWMVIDNEKRIRGLAVIRGEWGRPHQLFLRVDPDWHGRFEQALLQKMIHGLRTLPRRNVQLIHPADDEAFNNELVAANFSRYRTLKHMRIRLA
jgi:ribosomal protein S18 acetylase RimI-like enzyme